MTLVSRLLPESRVIIDLDVASKKRVFEHVGLVFESSLGIGATTVYESLFTRERLGSTGLGQGIAVPHGRIKGLREAAGAFIRLKQAIAFEAPDGKPVSLIFALLVPHKETEVHLQILSELADMFSDRALRGQIEAAGTPEELRHLIVSWEPHAPTQHRPAV